MKQEVTAVHLETSKLHNITIRHLHIEEASQLLPAHILDAAEKSIPKPLVPSATGKAMVE